MEERGVLEGLSWQSLKERFKSSIVKRLDLFGLDEQQEGQLKQGGKRVKGRGGRRAGGCQHP